VKQRNYITMQINNSRKQEQDKSERGKNNDLFKRKHVRKRKDNLGIFLIDFDKLQVRQDLRGHGKTSIYVFRLPISFKGTISSSFVQFYE